ncbi:winged helix-turn-helix domain-containing protein [Pseudaminobacter soli (ex Li et al. 2025)]|uniref:OmpR/PhoB-type domain-containing protein n=1 Tax=Pseudaminobacter soli (ex Li et al. 2025) TaxID=1295366 RepID=A0A2P7SE23_9HYPH|nr:winged helix-turn-helix domain-containing protein [Mesorhizobium soli]PSJ60766.1 hypothetical protein C7I85_12040 [Mesorhizobium soli]
MNRPHLHCPTCGQPTRHDDLEGVIIDRGLTRSQAEILRAIVGAKGRTVTHDHILDALYRDDPDGGPEYARTIVTVFISQLRKKLAGTGIDIMTVWGVGYRLDAAKARLPR